MLRRSRLRHQALILLSYLRCLKLYPQINPHIEERKKRKKRALSLCFCLFFAFFFELGPLHTPGPRREGGERRRSRLPPLQMGPKIRDILEMGPVILGQRQSLLILVMVIFTAVMKAR